MALGNYVIPCVPIRVPASGSAKALANVLLYRFTRLTIDVTLIILAVFLPGWFSGAYILLVANFVTIIGIVFTTVWAINQSTIMRCCIIS